MSPADDSLLAQGTVEFRDEERRAANRGPSNGLTTLTVTERCADCQWPETCAADGTCWNAEAEASEHQVAALDLPPERKEAMPDATMTVCHAEGCENEAPTRGRYAKFCAEHRPAGKPPKKRAVRTANGNTAAKPAPVPSVASPETVVALIAASLADQLAGHVLALPGDGRSLVVLQPGGEHLLVTVNHAELSIR